MNTTFIKIVLPSLFLLAGSVLLADSPATVSSPAIDPLAEALPILQAKYPDFKDLQYKKGDDLSDLLARSKGRIGLVASDIHFATSPIVTASLPGNIFYCRLASFVPEKSWMDLGTQLEQASPSAVGIILDLRSNVAPDDYNGAARILGFFAPLDRTLFKYETGGIGNGARLPDHPFRLPMVVLTNNQTTGAAEALAACLKADGALVVGRPTSGKAAIFEEQKLSSGQVLRYVVANVSLPDGTPLWGHPVNPDITLVVHEQAEKGALILIGHHDILDVIGESPERHRLSEASLVHGQDPEWDAYLTSLEKKPFLLTLPTIHDVVLITALDSLKAINLSQRQTASSSPADAKSPIQSSTQ